MKYRSTLVLRGVIIALGLIVLALCVVGLPIAIIAELKNDFDYGFVFAGLYVPAIPFFIALFNALKLLDYIDTNKAFTKASVKALQNIKKCALAISGIFTVGLPYVFWLADKDDSPGIVALCVVIFIASFVIATAAALFQQLFQNAVDIKTENDLTV